MRDQHRPKQDLINEVTGLRKQIADLREAMTARRRVEDALRQSEEQLRQLVDAAPVEKLVTAGEGFGLRACVGARMIRAPIVGNWDHTSGVGVMADITGPLSYFSN